MFACLIELWPEEQGPDWRHSWRFAGVLSEDRDWWVPSQQHVLCLAPAAGHHLLAPERNLLEGAFTCGGWPSLYGCCPKDAP